MPYGAIHVLQSYYWLFSEIGFCITSCSYIYKRFPAKTFTNVGMVQRVIKNRVRAPTHHTGNKSPDTRRGSLASLAIRNPCRSRFIAFKRLCIHCTQVNILRRQVTLKPLSPSLEKKNWRKKKKKKKKKKKTKSANCQGRFLRAGAFSLARTVSIRLCTAHTFY